MACDYHINGKILSEDEFKKYIASTDLKISGYGLKYTVPDMPFKNDKWVELATKKAIQIATQEGYDGIAWINGEQTKDRYDLSKQVESIGYQKRGELYNVTVWDKSGKQVYQNQSATAAEIEKTIGKEMLDRMNQGVGRKEGNINYLEDLNLKVGGKWANNLYDKQIPKLVEKYSKQYGGKTTEFGIDGGIKQVDTLYDMVENKDGTFDVKYKNEVIAENLSHLEANKFIDKKIKENPASDSVSKQFGLEITPEMKGSTESLPMFMKRPDGEILGFTHEGKIYLNAEHLNPNTLVHEGGHIWTEWAKDKAPEIYKRGIELLHTENGKGSKYLQAARENKFYITEVKRLGLKGKEAEAYYEHEALATAIGDKGAQFVSEARRKTFKDWVNDLFEKIGKALGFKNVTASELQDMTFDEFTKKASEDILKGEPQNIKAEKGSEPPVQPPDEKVNSGDNLNEWTRVNLANLSAVREQFRKVGIPWDTRKQEAMRVLESKSHEGETLYNTAAREMNNFHDRLTSGETPRFNTSDQVAMHFFKIATEQQIAKLSDAAGKEGDFSFIHSLGAELLTEHLDKVNAVLGSMRSESGVGLAYGTVEARLHPDYGLQVRRMEMLRRNDGEPLSQEQESFLKEQWAKEKDIMQREHEARERGMQENFDKKIAEIQKEYEAKLQKPEPKIKTLSKSGKDVADIIRKLKLRGTKVDFTFGSWNLAVEAIAQIVEKGATIADAIKQLVAENKIGFKNDSDQKKFEDELVDGFAAQEKNQAALDKIKILAESGATDITPEMVSKNLIRDLVGSHIGRMDKSAVLDAALENLQELLPDVTKQQLAEAYLKKGDFKTDTRRQVENKLRDGQAEIRRLAKKELTATQNQRIKLQADKDRVTRDIKELNRKLSEGEYSTDNPTVLNKADAELIKLSKEKAQLDARYRKEQRILEEKNKHWSEHVAATLRGAWVAYLIGGPTTLLKIGWMSIIRPISEILSKTTFGKVFQLIEPNISKAARRGGESNSWATIGKMTAAYFKQIGPEKMQRMYERGEKRYEEAAKAYNDYKATANPSAEKLSSLKNDMDRKMVDAMGNVMFQFIGGSSVKDAWKALKNRANVIEEQFGTVEREAWKEGGALDKFNYAINFIGRSHTAIKTFSGRANFAAGFMARVESAVMDGEPMDSNRLIEMAHESYLDWERGKYQQSNYISDKWNTLINSLTRKTDSPRWKNYNKAATALLRAEVAITRVPVNIIHEQVAEYLLGAFRYPILEERAYQQARSQVVEEGLTLVKSPEFKARIREVVSEMDPKQAAKIERLFRKGMLGMGLYATALIWGGIQFGIFPHMGQKKKKDDDKLRKDELNPGQIMVGDKKWGEVASKTVEHTPALWVMFMGLGMARIYHDDIKKKKTTPEAAADAIFTHLNVIESSIPQTKAFGTVTGGIKNVGYAVKKSLVSHGVIKDAKTGKKKPLNFLGH